MLASKHLRLSSHEAMNVRFLIIHLILKVAESLYTRGIISYPRTETTKFPSGLDIKKLVSEQTQSSVWGSYAAKYEFPLILIALDF